MSFIETDRLFLRAWMVPGDVERAAAIYGDEEVMRFLPRAAVRREEIPAFLERFESIGERDPGLGLWPVVEKASRSVVGTCGLARMPSGDGVEIVWHLARDAWGRGFATEAAAAVLEYGFSHLHLPRIHALVDPGNRRSIAVTRRLGMSFDRLVRAYRRDLLRYVKTID